MPTTYARQPLRHTARMAAVEHALEDYAYAGLDGAQWYHDMERITIELFGDQARLFRRLLAVTSPNCTVRANVTLAYKALHQIRHGQPIHGYLGTVTEAIHYAAHGVVWAGPKVRAFAANLNGDLYPVTVDRWIVRAAGRKSAPKDLAEYTELAHMVRRVSARMQMQPAECQAAIWTGVKRDWEGREPESFVEILREPQQRKLWPEVYRAWR